ncbi:nuclear transport factor 2 family protein [Flavobacterium hercynium]|uniref:Nuclear transport factor 2 family protein n=1 Tax=Flavobacterium hercynium TaxID=387094 RepID=A0A226H8J4_9FLAO|nr:nuclear transport factor 2 family protein [Flavobacterium hercynium]OXA89996.1 hypothetical protein B0A66_13395 [Flavobacterium hercynium]SMP14197.1 Putative lumazine-binding [Flavobacterium hercynium]
MRTRTTLLVVLIALFSSINAQSQEKALIEKAMQSYLDGWQTGDTIKLGKVIHATCKLKNIVDDQIVVTDRKTYLSRFQPHPKAKGVEGKVLAIDITGNTAAVKSEIRTPEVVITDYFNLLKLKDQWYIVDKIYGRAEVK